MSIIQKQELPENIELLAAQRNLYSRAKNIIGLQMMLSGPIAVSAAILTIARPDMKGYVALWTTVSNGQASLHLKYPDIDYFLTWGSETITLPKGLYAMELPSGAADARLLGETAAVWLAETNGTWGINNADDISVKHGGNFSGARQ